MERDFPIFDEDDAIHAFNTAEVILDTDDPHPEDYSEGAPDEMGGSSHAS